MKKILYLFSLSMVCLSAAQAQTIYSYTTDTSGQYNSVATNATGVRLTRYDGATRPGSPCSTGFSTATFSSAATYATTQAAVEADVTANAGYLLSVTGFTAGLRRSGSGPANVRLAYSTDGGTTWIDKGSDDAPNNAGCGSTATATWTTAFTVSSSNTLKFRIFGFNASATSGTMQILNLAINGTVITTDSIFTTAASFGPFCAGVPDTISVPFTQSGGGFTGPFQVQISDASGIFPNDATSNIISTGSTTSPVQAVIPSGTPWANGYRVRVVNNSPTFYGSGDNGSNIVINQSVTPSFSILPLTSTSTCSGSSLGFTTASVNNGGSNPVFTWFVNGSSAGTGSTFSSTTFNNNDSVFAILVSNAQCAIPTTVNSTKIGVTVYPTASTALYDTICPGASVSFGARSLTVTGTYYDTLQTVHSCDSVIILHLFVKSMHTSSLSASICQGDSYTWNGHTYTSATTVNDTVRCDSISTLVLTIKTVQRVNVPVSICTGDSYTWNGHSYSTAGSYADTIRCDSIATLLLVVNTLPTVAFNPTVTYICTNIPPAIAILSGGAPSGGFYSGNFVSGDTFNTHGQTDSAWIKYTFTNSDHCSNTDSVLFRASICEGITETDISTAISIYPNPTENKVHIDANDLSGESTITLTDMMGKVLFSKAASGSAVHEDIDLSSYEKGIYLLSIHDAAGMGTKQVVKY